ncbi:bifunctional glutamate N-acetyltransferase/amino-acid acetyltransferase ArgJ [Spirochaeta cellobiosiphila]|uniref:bifunctional glutamate N-acetyltransferase/amino-acid acetyltransferase ArgJ n=1 Tax=Spirochaeta cellobiosiphila TaxID=504483 RepID=UPI00041F43BE|nr:bifunctional glutamate N-acetyltransferase/amino-acid acetyltransferase ArgJ [Spirochaeta cellobiosiphila]
MKLYQSTDDYWNDLGERSQLPEGFQTAVTQLKFIPKEMVTNEPLPMNLNLILLDEASTGFAAVFTQNAFPGYPVIIGRRRLKESTAIRGILINNKIANVLCAEGEEKANTLCREIAQLTGASEEQFFPSSTGIIGWELPCDDIKRALPSLVKSLSRKDARSLAKGIMTTDSYPKVRSLCYGNCRITAVAKGAGMIEPNMATMLCFIMTDANHSKEELQQCLQDAVGDSFNSISVDSDQSTSDSVIILSSQKKKSNLQDFKECLNRLCKDLAQDIVRNGEGTSHVIELTVQEASHFDMAKALGKNVINSPLVKTAIYGNDPNVGRIVSSLGDCAGNAGFLLDAQKLTIKIGDITVYSQGSFQLTPDKEKALNQYLRDCSYDEHSLGYPQHDKKVEILVKLGLGIHTATVTGSDLSHQYINENADYRS